LEALLESHQPRFRRAVKLRFQQLKQMERWKLPSIKTGANAKIPAVVFGRQNPVARTLGRAKGQHGGSSAAVRKDAKDKYTLNYLSLRVAMNKKRRTALVLCASIDGTQFKDFKRGTDKWFLDPRIDTKFQMGESFMWEPIRTGAI